MSKKRYYFQTEETTVVTRKAYIEIEEDFMQVYHDFLSVSPFLKVGTSYQLLFWLGVNMNDSNTIHIGETTFNDFNKYLFSHCEQCKISRATFFRAVDELNKANILTKVSRAFYYLNPHFFWKGTKNARIELLRDEHGEKNGLSYSDKQNIKK